MRPNTSIVTTAFAGVPAEARLKETVNPSGVPKYEDRRDRARSRIPLEGT